jgi:hypothetical protein
MGLVKLRRIEDLASRGVLLRATCPVCGDSATFDPHAVARFFAGAGWNTSLDIAPFRVRCAKSDAKPCALSAVAIDMQLPATRPRLMPAPPCPVGIDASAWVNADAWSTDREAK